MTEMSGTVSFGGIIAALPCQRSAVKSVIEREKSQTLGRRLINTYPVINSRDGNEEVEILHTHTHTTRPRLDAKQQARKSVNTDAGADDKSIDDTTRREKRRKNQISIRFQSTNHRMNLFPHVIIDVVDSVTDK